MNFRVTTTLRKKVEKREGTQRIKWWHPLSPTSTIIAFRPANHSSLVEEVVKPRPLVPATVLCGPMCLPLPTTILSCLNTALTMATSTSGRLLMMQVCSSCYKYTVQSTTYAFSSWNHKWSIYLQAHSD